MNEGLPCKSIEPTNCIKWHQVNQVATMLSIFLERPQLFELTQKKRRQDYPPQVIHLILLELVIQKHS